MRFYLGTHDPYWLWRDDLAGWAGGVQPPLFLSRRRLGRLRRLKPVPDTVAWAVDSGGFSELHDAGRWTVDADVYVAEVARWTATLGRPDFAAIMDWMVEPSARARTGQTVDRHQQRTVASYLQLRWRAPDLPWAPVLQGWDDDGGHPADAYLRCLERYVKAGVDVDDPAIPVWGVGSLCRRTDVDDITTIVATLARHGLAGRMHLFGVKQAGLTRLTLAGADAHRLVCSADSLAWSLTARYAGPDPTCPAGPHGTDGNGHCGNCIAAAGRWWAKVVAAVGTRPTEPDRTTVRPGVGHHRIGTPEPATVADVADRDRLAAGAGRPLAAWRAEWLAMLATVAGLGPDAVAVLDATLPVRPTQLLGGIDDDDPAVIDAAVTRTLPAAMAALRACVTGQDGWTVTDGRR